MILRVAVAAMLALPGCATLAPRGTVEPLSSPPDVVAIQLLAFNDFHGHLEPPTGSNGRVGSTEAGGVEYFATHLRRLEERNPNTLIVAAGDLIGASPLLSGLIHDEPTIEALNAAGLDVSSVGNHEFDDGSAELLRIQNGGCHPVDGCQGNRSYAGAAFQYLAANVLLHDSRTLLPPYVVKEIGGVKLGFIGVTLRGTPQLVSAASVEGLRFESEAETVNRWVPILRQQGVRAIIVLIHQGGSAPTNGYDGCDGVSGPIKPIVLEMSDEVDLVISGHSHVAYVCSFDGKLVTSAASFGRLITAIALQVDTRTNNIVSKRARNIVVTRDVPKHPAQTAILDRYRPLHAAVAGQLAGTITGDITRSPNDAGETALGNLIADAILELARETIGGDATVAFMNPGGIRADLTRSPSARAGEYSTITYGNVFDVLPFQNRVVVKTLTGELIRKALEQQFDNPAARTDRILQVSAGFTYSYDRSRPQGERVDGASIRMAGEPISPTQKYRVAFTDFLADGGDNFPAFAEGTDAVYSTLMDVDAMVVYLTRHSPIDPPALNRITRTNSR